MAPLALTSHTMRLVFAHLSKGTDVKLKSNGKLLQFAYPCFRGGIARHIGL